MRCVRSIFVAGAVCVMAGSASARYATARLPIVGGEPAGEDQLYGTVALVDPSTGQPFCTGTLIAPKLVLTAAHCLVEQNSDTDEIVRYLDVGEVEVVAGALEPTQAAIEERYEATRLVLHAGYPFPGSNQDDPVGLGEQNDIALVAVGTEVTQVEVISILPMAQVDEVLTSGAALIISGYGLTEPGGSDGGVLHIAETDFQRHNGKEYFARGATDSCQGDSGGPGYVWHNGQAWLVGASARGNEAAQTDCGEGGINTLVPAYRAWIEAEGGEDFQPPAPATPAPAASGEDGCTAAPVSGHGPWAALCLTLLALVGVRMSSRNRGVAPK